MDDLTVNAEKHEYVTPDGRIVPSVSDVKACISNMIYRIVDPVILSMAAKRGSEIHEYTKQLDEHKTVDVPANRSGYVQAWAKCVNEHKITNLYCEESMLHNAIDEDDIDYAGTIDRFSFFDGKKTLIDLKSNSKITQRNLVDYEAQLNLYRVLLEDHCEKVEQMYIVHLKKDGTYKLYEIPIGDKLIDSCKYIYKRMNEKKRRVKKNG